MSCFGLATACMWPSRLLYSLGTHTLKYLTRLNRFTCVAAYQLHSLGSAVVVAFPSARFSTRRPLRTYLGGATFCVSRQGRPPLVGANFVAHMEYHCIKVRYKFKKKPKSPSELAYYRRYGRDVSTSRPYSSWTLLPLKLYFWCTFRAPLPFTYLKKLG